jgi:hypothetical protein
MKPKETSRSGDETESVCGYAQAMCLVSLLIVGRDSSVGIATRHGLDGPGIESR